MVIMNLYSTDALRVSAAERGRVTKKICFCLHLTPPSVHDILKNASQLQYFWTGGKNLEQLESLRGGCSCCLTSPASRLYTWTAFFPLSRLRCFKLFSYSYLSDQYHGVCLFFNFLLFYYHCILFTSLCFRQLLRKLFEKPVNVTHLMQMLKHYYFQNTNNESFFPLSSSSFVKFLKICEL